MKELFRANLRSHGRRYMATGLAVMIAVIFMLSVLILGTGLSATMKKTLVQQYEGATASVKVDESGENNLSMQETLDAIQKPAEVKGAGPIVWNRVELSSENEGAVSTSGTVGYLLPEPLNRPTLQEGALPTGPNQIVLDGTTAKVLNAKVGQKIHAKDMMGGEKTLTLDVVGIFGEKTKSLVNVSPNAAIMTGDGLKALTGDEGSYASEYLVAGAEGYSQQEVADAINSSLGKSSSLKATTGEEATENVLTQLKMSTAQMNMIFMIFPAIAVVVAVIVISTTFQVIIQQRQREIGLLRCIGATGKQVRRLVVGETLAVGVIASVLGVIIGALAASAGVTILGLYSSFPEALASIGPANVIFVFLFGVFITLISGLRPAMRVAKTPPLVAFNAGAVESVKHSGGWWARLIVGLLTTIGACALMVHGVNLGESRGFMYALMGGFFALFGLALFLSSVFPYLALWVSAPVRGMLGRMAAGNSLRNPGRTAATGVSVVIGVSLIVMMMVGASSLRATTSNQLDSRMPYDLTVSLPSGALSDADVQAISGVKGIAIAKGQQGLKEGATVDGTDISVNDADAVTQVVRSKIPTPTDDEILLPPSLAPEGTKTVKLCVDTKCRDLKVLKDSSWTASANAGGVSAATLKSLGGSPQTLQVVAQLENTSDYKLVEADLTRINPNFVIDGAAGQRAKFDQMINVTLAVIVALLAVSVLVSLVGVSNTLALSVAERTRENGLLRALGMTKRQVSRMLTLEALVISVTASLIGIVAGIFFGWMGVQAIMQTMSKGTILAIPWLQIAAVLGIAVLSAVIASWLPGRRAGRTSPVEALATE